MLKKATESDRQTLLVFLSVEPSINLFIIGDIELYGFEQPFQDVWLQTEQDADEPIGVVLRYYQNFIVYGREKLNSDEIVTFLEKADAALISGKAMVIDKLLPSLNHKYDLKALNFAELRSAEFLLTDISEVTLADSNDATAIATAYEQIPEFDSLYPGDLSVRAHQIAHRIDSGEGVHMVIRKEGSIVSHGNTAAENSVSGMIGGVMTLNPYRRSQYSSQVVSALCKHLLDQDKTACLFYHGVASGDLFHKLGFKDIDQWHILGGKKK